MDLVRTLRLRTSRPWLTSRGIVYPAFLILLVGVAVLSAFAPQAIMLLMPGIPVGIGLVTWPEITLGLYANAGLFKADSRLGAIASLADLTLAFGAVLAAAIAFRLVLRRERFKWGHELSLMLVFCGVILFSLIYSPSRSYGTEKAFRFVSLTMLAFVAPMVMIKSYRAVWLFFLGWLGVTMVLVTDALGRLSTGQRLSAFSGTGIGVSRTVGAAVLMLIFAVLMGRVSRWLQVLAVLGLLLMLVVLLGSGSRGPLLTLVVTVALTAVATIGKSQRRARTVVIAGILGLALLGVLSSGLIPKVSLQRFDALFNQVGEDRSSQARLGVMQVAWHLFASSPLVGRGMGSVSTVGAGQNQVYPHNVLLELAAETGLVGLGIYLAVMGLVLWRLFLSLGRSGDQQPILLTLLALVLFSLLNSMVSGDLSDNRDVWLFAGLAIAVTHLGEAT